MPRNAYTYPQKEACCELFRRTARITWKPDGRKDERGYYLAYDAYGCASCGPTAEAYTYDGRLSFCPFCGSELEVVGA